LESAEVRGLVARVDFLKVHQIGQPHPAGRHLPPHGRTFTLPEGGSGEAESSGCRPCVYVNPWPCGVSNDPRAKANSATFLAR
jgi:hypothetical protein